MLKYLKYVGISASIALMIALFSIGLRNAFFLSLQPPVNLDPPVNKAFSRKSDFVMLTNKTGASGGTGFALKGKSGKVYTVTNGHVCDGVKDDDNMLYGHDALDPTRVIRLRIIENAGFSDLCILDGMPKASGFEVSTQPPLAYSKAFVIGFPALEPLQPSEGYVLTPIHAEVPVNTAIEDCTEAKEKVVSQVVEFFGLSAKMEVCVLEIDALASTIRIFPGSSGSPVFNAAGEVIGVAFAAGTSNNGMLLRHSDVEKLMAVY